MIEFEEKMPDAEQVEVSVLQEELVEAIERIATAYNKGVEKEMAYLKISQDDIENAEALPPEMTTPEGLQSLQLAVGDRVVEVFLETDVQENWRTPEARIYVVTINDINADGSFTVGSATYTSNRGTTSHGSDGISNNLKHIQYPDRPRYTSGTHSDRPTQLLLRAEPLTQERDIEEPTQAPERMPQSAGYQEAMRAIM